MPQAHFLIVSAAIFLAPDIFANDGPYLENNGIVVMETEGSSSPLGLWKKDAAIEGHTGDGYLEFTGNNAESGIAKSPLEYPFQITTSGLYYLHLHCARGNGDDSQQGAR